MPPPGLVRFGDLRRLEPFSREWGVDRGGAVDRYYVENFLASRSADIRGHVLELGEGAYTRRFGTDAVTDVDVRDRPAGSSPGATLVADLASADYLASETFDCVIATQTLQFVYDVRVAASTLYRILRPGGTLLVTVPGISQVCHHDHRADQWCWQFTALSMKRVFSSHFTPEGVEVTSHGNVLAATAFLYGLGRSEIDTDELDQHDADYEMVITVRARKEGAP